MRSVSSGMWEALQQQHVEIVELIEIAHPNLNLNWTTGNKSLVSSGTTYSVFAGQSQGGVAENADLTVSVAGFIIANRSGEFDGLLDGANFDAASVVVRRVLVSSPDLGSIEIFRGKMGDIKWTRNQIEGSVRNLWGSANQSWPLYSYRDGCSWKFGSTGCGVVTNSFTVTFSATQIASASPIVIHLNSGTLTQSYDNGYFDFGRITFVTGADSGDLRSVRLHSGDSLALSHRLPSEVLTGAFTIFPGCRKRLVPDCTSKYNNASAFLGFPWIPIQEDVV